MSKPPEVYSLIAWAQGKVKAIAKDQENDQQNFKYRGIDQVLNAVHPILDEAGLVVIPTTSDLSRDVHTVQTKKGQRNYATVFGTVTYEIIAPDGSKHVATIACEASDYSDKATNKAYANAYKYLMFQMLSIPIDMDDGDAESPPPGGKQPSATSYGKKEHLRRLIDYLVTERGIDRRDGATMLEVINNALIDTGNGPVEDSGKLTQDMSIAVLNYLEAEDGNE